MATLSIAQTYNLLRQAGFSAASAVTMTAIAMGESGLRDNAVGDVGLQSATWGPSYGLFQVRTLKAQTGTGGNRDIKALTGDPLRQARAAYEISSGGRNFKPWTVYTSGKAAGNLGKVYAALGIDRGSLPPDMVPAPPIGSSIEQAGLGLPDWLNPVTGLKKLLHMGGDVAGAAAGAALDPVGKAIGDAGEKAIEGLGKLTVIGAGLAVAGALVVLGFWRGVQPTVQRVKDQVDEAAAPAAAMAAKGAL